ncbi:hypothetical protein [Microvirga alba]|uniref:Uncharacterized protein n=1 Tax=Microvirga alba TaxID=2791025 RepID=A0A931FLS8_9HYPH|nr:hypothetical protein [Microvirga alba]MBF9232399.1 hypothetical protein [Microvirga alba]
MSLALHQASMTRMRDLPRGRAEAVLYSYLPDSAWSREAAHELVEYHMLVALELGLIERASELGAALGLMRQDHRDPRGVPTNPSFEDGEVGIHDLLDHATPVPDPAPWRRTT